ncbi:hypothetical protein Gotur_002663 [Gossypium turneri]
MSVEEEYYINLHVGGKFVHDPHFRYLGGEMDNLTVVWNDSSTIDMINYWVVGSKFGEREGGEVVGNKGGKDEGGGEGEGEGREAAGSKGGEGDCDEVASSKGGEGVEGQGVGEGGEVAGGLGGEGDDVAICNIPILGLVETVVSGPQIRRPYMAIRPLVKLVDKNGHEISEIGNL